ncbi:unnamed protein product [Amoebophrya sp. A25]|nr:unnamed protein product [Amoebophrya sp. A25]|eukprot:GSA25T00004117001.1
MDVPRKAFLYAVLSPFLVPDGETGVHFVTRFQLWLDRQAHALGAFSQKTLHQLEVLLRQYQPDVSADARQFLQLPPTEFVVASGDVVSGRGDAGVIEDVEIDSMCSTAELRKCTPLIRAKAVAGQGTSRDVFLGRGVELQHTSGPTSSTTSTIFRPCRVSEFLRRHLQQIYLLPNVDGDAGKVHNNLIHKLFQQKGGPQLCRHVLRKMDALAPIVEAGFSSSGYDIAPIGPQGQEVAGKQAQEVWHQDSHLVNPEGALYSTVDSQQTGSTALPDGVLLVVRVAEKNQNTAVLAADAEEINAAFAVNGRVRAAILEDWTRTKPKHNHAPVQLGALTQTFVSPHEITLMHPEDMLLAEQQVEADEKVLEGDENKKDVVDHVAPTNDAESTSSVEGGGQEVEPAPEQESKPLDEDQLQKIYAELPALLRKPRVREGYFSFVDIGKETTKKLAGTRRTTSANPLEASSTSSTPPSPSSSSPIPQQDFKNLDDLVWRKHHGSLSARAVATRMVREAGFGKGIFCDYAWTAAELQERIQLTAEAESLQEQKVSGVGEEVNEKGRLEEGKLKLTTSGGTAPTTNTNSSMRALFATVATPISLMAAPEESLGDSEPRQWVATTLVGQSGPLSSIADYETPFDYSVTDENWHKEDSEDGGDSRSSTTSSADGEDGGKQVDMEQQDVEHQQGEQTILVPQLKPDDLAEVIDFLQSEAQEPGEVADLPQHCSWLDVQEHTEYFEPEPETLFKLWKSRFGNAFSTEDQHESMQQEHRRPRLVYSCAPHTLCGGHGDRAQGIVNAFLLALLLGRDFYLDSENPVPWSMLFTANVIDWRVEHLDSSLDMVNAHDTRFHQEIPWLVANRAETILINTNLREVGQFLNHPLFRDKSVRLGLSGTPFLAQMIWHFLFRPSFFLQNQIQNARDNLHIGEYEQDTSSSGSTYQPYLALHFRAGNESAWWDPSRHALQSLVDDFFACAWKVEAEIFSPRMLFSSSSSPSSTSSTERTSSRSAWSTSSTISKSDGLPWYLASDTDRVRRLPEVRTLIRSGKLKMLANTEVEGREEEEDRTTSPEETNYEISHLDRSKAAKRLNGIVPAFVSWYLLQDATAVVLSRSGFGETAAELGRSGQNAYFAGHGGCVKTDMTAS